MRTRARIIALVLVVIAVTIYVFAALAYGRSLAPQEVTEVEPPPIGVAVTLVQSDIKPDAPLTAATVAVQPGKKLVDSDGRLLTTFSVSIIPSIDGQELVFKKGDIPEGREITIPLQGRVQNYPFDRYTANLVVTAFLPPDPVTGAAQSPMPVTAALSFRDAGWRLDSSSDRTGAALVLLKEQISRGGSTIVFSLILLALMVVVAMLSNWVAITILGGGMKAEVSVASWMAALLFALIPIRNFLPGAPPVGSWIDILVFFWVEVAVMVAMVTVVTTLITRAWRKQKADIEAEDRRAEKAKAATAAKEDHDPAADIPSSSQAAGPGIPAG